MVPRPHHRASDRNADTWRGSPVDEVSAVAVDSGELPGKHGGLDDALDPGLIREAEESVSTIYAKDAKKVSLSRG